MAEDHVSLSLDHWALIKHKRPDGPLVAGLSTLVGQGDRGQTKVPVKWLPWRWMFERSFLFIYFFWGLGLISSTLTLLHADIRRSTSPTGVSLQFRPLISLKQTRCCSCSGVWVETWYRSDHRTDGGSHRLHKMAAITCRAAILAPEGGTKGRCGSLSWQKMSCVDGGSDRGSERDIS